MPMHAYTRVQVVCTAAPNTVVHWSDMLSAATALPQPYNTRNDTSAGAANYVKPVTFLDSAYYGGM